MTQRLPSPRFASLLLAALAVVLPAEPAQAAGYYVYEIGPKAVGRAGAVMVNPGDPTAMWLNPAAITNVTGLQLRLDGALVHLDGSFTRDCGPNNDCGPRALVREYGEGRRFEVKENRAPADDVNGPVYTPKKGNLGRLNTPSDFGDGHAVRNQADLQPIPGLWAVLNLDTFGLDGFALGFAAYAPYAGDYRFGEDEYTRYSLIDRDLLEFYYQATLAYRFQNWIAVGASLQGVSAGVRQQVKLSADPYGNENPDYDLLVELDTLQHFIPSANFGVWSNPLPGLELGASLQLGRTVSAGGSMEILEKGSEVQALIDGGAVTLEENDPRATTSFQMPAFWRVGAKYGMDGLFDGLLGFEIEGDFVYEQWSSYDHVFIETTGVSFAFGGGDPAALEPIVQARDWQDAWSLRLGGEVDFLNELFALRTGVMYETAAVPSSSLSVELLNGEKVGVGVGGSVKLWGVSLDVGYGHMFVFDRTAGDESIIYAENPVRSLNPEPRTRVAMGRYAISYDVLSVGLNVAFDEMIGFGVYAKRPKAEPLPPVEPALEEVSVEQPTLTAPKIAVLDFQGTGLSDDEEATIQRLGQLTDAARSGAIKSGKGHFNVLTKANQDEVLAAQGFDPLACEGECDVSIMRRMQVEYGFTGQVVAVPGRWRIQLDLYDAKTGIAVDTETINMEGEDSGRLLLDALDRVSETTSMMLQRSLQLDSSSLTHRSHADNWTALGSPA